MLPVIIILLPVYGRTGSEATLQPGSSRLSVSRVSTSEFSSCVSLSGQELEFDLYDCDIDNVMAAPGSLFAPAYWDQSDTGIDLEMGDIFSPVEDTSRQSCSPVTMRHTRATTCLVTSVTSDLTASISSAVSNTTLVGDNNIDTNMDTSCYHSDDDDDTGNSPESFQKEKNNIMNITHIEDDIQFVDE